MPQMATSATTAQRMFARYLVAILIDLAILNFFVEYSGKVFVDSFTTSFLAAIVLQVLLKATKVNGIEAAMGSAQAERWQFHITVLRLNGRVYRFLTAAPATAKGVAEVASAVTSSFTALTDSERLALKPTRIRVITVEAGDTIGSLAAQMVGTERPQELFRLLNGLSAGGTVSVGSQVKIVTDR